MLGAAALHSRTPESTPINTHSQQFSQYISDRQAGSGRLLAVAIDY